MVPFAQQPASANATAVPDNAPPRDACGRGRRPDAEQPRAKRPRAEAPGRQGAPCRTSRAAPQASEQKSADHVVTEEPINIAALKDFASRRAADTLVLSGCAATVRECIFYFLKCARRVSDELGVLTVVWHEASSFQDHGIATRRYSGVREEDDDNLPTGLKALLAAGIPSVFVGRSLFGLPKMLKYMARTGLPACDIDQTNAHFRCQLSRHPNARELGKYVHEREAILQSVMAVVTPAPHWPPGRTTRSVVKDLFISLGYGGSVRTWCERYEVDEGRLPAFVKAFAREQAALRRCDVCAHLDVNKQATKASHARPDVNVQSTLNLQCERKRLEAMETQLGNDGPVTAAYEHDGLFVWHPPWHDAPPKDWEKHLLHRINLHGVPVELKPIPGREELFAQLKALAPEKNWDTVSEDWDTQDHV